MKRIGLVVAAAMLGTTGVASAGIAVHQFTSSDGSQSVSLDAKTEQLAANCWVATGAGNAAECKTSAAAPGLPGLDSVTGLVDAQGLVHTAQGVAGQAVAAAGDAAAQAAAASPLDCNVSAGVPSGVVPPAVGSAVPKQVTDAAGQALQTVGSVTGVNVGTNGSGTTAVGCGADTSGATAAAGAASGAAGKAAGAATGAINNVAGTAGNVVDGVAGTAGNVVDGVTGTAGNVVDGVTGTAGNVVDGVTGTAGNVVGGVVGGVTGGVGGLLGGGAVNCSASGGASSGLLGSVSISGSC